MHLMDGTRSAQAMFVPACQWPPDDNLVFSGLSRRSSSVRYRASVSNIAEDKNALWPNGKNCVMEMTGKYVFIIRSFQDKDKDQSLRMPVQPYDVTQLQKYANTR